MGYNAIHFLRSGEYDRKPNKTDTAFVHSTDLHVERVYGSISRNRQSQHNHKHTPRRSGFFHRYCEENHAKDSQCQNNMLTNYATLICQDQGNASGKFSTAIQYLVVCIFQ